MYREAKQMRTSAQYQGVVSDYSLSSMYNTGYTHPGAYKVKKDRVFKETHDFISMCKEQRRRINNAISKGARILPCLK